ncbi:MAG: chemotaxis response regulator protein-glutamate methylesterase [Rhodocyclales bacterium]|nr:chemotaxis response regulator protein-glutamate methylesterase [Rhodocyclales bacterium]
MAARPAVAENMKIKVLVVDDSAAVRLMLSEIIGSASDMQVVGQAADEVQARLAIAEKRPDVITLNVGMSSMKGLDFLTALMRERPMPVLVIAEASAHGSKLALRAVELGAIDFVARPYTLASSSGRAAAEGIRDRLREAYQSRAALRSGSVGRPAAAEPVLKQLAPASALLEKVIFIGASTGGTEAIREVLTPLPAEMPPILIVQHMPELFTASFAKRLDSLARVRVKEAEHDEPIKPGTAYLAPGHSHLSVKRGAGGLVCELSDGPPVNRHRPSVDVLFLSAARILGPKALGILLTGMGKDGAQGMLAMRQAGAWTVAQDQDTCVVWGMPREAMLIGGAQEVAALKSIPDLLLQRLRSGERRAA